MPFAIADSFSIQKQKKYCPSNIYTPALHNIKNGLRLQLISASANETHVKLKKKHRNIKQIEWKENGNYFIQFSLSKMYTHQLCTFASDALMSNRILYCTG
jgi:hypothetical protein